VAVQLEQGPAPLAAEPVLEVIDLVTEIRTMRGPVRPVNRVSLRVAPGQAVGLVGESGSGKSMTAFSIMRLFPTPAARVVEGRVLLQGRDLTPLPEAELRRVRGSRMGMVFQDPSAYLNPVLTVGAQIAEQLRAHRWPGPVEERVAHLLRQVGLRPEVARRYPHELSGGMRQRVSIASAIACDPPLVLADEPTTALDVTVQAQILQLLARLQRERQMGLLLITHDFGIVAELCDYVYIMYAAEIVEEGPVEEVFDRPRHPYTQGLLAGMLSVTRRDRVRVTIPGSVPDLAQPPAGCRFHPRCARAMPQCRTAAPPRVTVGASRTACWLYDPGHGHDQPDPGQGGSHAETSIDGNPAG